MQVLEPQRVVIFFIFSSPEQKLSLTFPRLSGSKPGSAFHSQIEKPVDGVVASIALHYLQTERREPFFQSVYTLLSDPGCFICGGAYDTEDPFVQQRIELRRLEYTQEQLLETEGKHISMEKLWENNRQVSEKAGINRLLLREQIELLKQSGFASAEVVWRYLVMAVVAAYKR